MSDDAGWEAHQDDRHGWSPEGPTVTPEPFSSIHAMVWTVARDVVSPLQAFAELSVVVVVMKTLPCPG